MIFAPDKRIVSITAPPPMASSVGGITESAYTSRAAIVRVLEEVRDKRYELTIKLDRGDRLYVYKTRIQDIDAGTGQIVLHRLVPSNWQEAVGMMAEVEVQAQLASGQINFPALLTPYERDSSNPYCLMSLPTVINRQQLRSSFRVNVPARFSRVALARANEVITGHCINLSLEGSCCVFRGPADYFQKDGELAGIHFILDGTTQFKADATICRVDVLHGANTQVGLRFRKLDKDVQRKLQACLINFQRLSLRKPFEHD